MVYCKLYTRVQNRPQMTFCQNYRKEIQVQLTGFSSNEPKTKSYVNKNNMYLM